MTEGDWRETGNGNWVLPGLEGVEATVYATHDSMWGAIWNGALDGKPRRLKAKLDSAEEACCAVETAIGEGERSLMWWPPDDHWQKSKKGGCYRKLNGASVLSNKQNRKLGTPSMRLEGLSESATVLLGLPRKQRPAAQSTH